MKEDILKIKLDNEIPILYTLDMNSTEEIITNELPWIPATF